MIDEHTLIAEDLPFDQVSKNLRVGEGWNAGNFGEPIQLFVRGNVVFDIANSPYLLVEEALDDLGNPTNWNEAMRIGLGTHALTDKGLVFGVPTNITGVIRVSLVNVDSGTWHAGAKLRPL
jgi:hypothetical protein